MSHQADVQEYTTADQSSHRSLALSCARAFSGCAMLHTMVREPECANVVRIDLEPRVICP
jgi:hypothetical protein